MTMAKYFAGGHLRLLEGAWRDDAGDPVDIEPVVRCGECKHCDPETYHCDHPMGTMFPFSRKPDDFCSYGERKENNHAED